MKISSDVYYQDVVTQQNEKMTLQSVIESVQAGGVWLLQPKSDPRGRQRVREQELEPNKDA